ncbi:uncharacterized protein [Asterias amurensis]|uniref:uncharacterized protein n=1 Tax=Asterias amurensis TaxID=7602 RepID=UPI003AB41E02
MEWKYFGEIDDILGARLAINPRAGQVLHVGLLNRSRDHHVSISFLFYLGPTDELSQSSELENTLPEESDNEEDAGNADPERPRQIEAYPLHDDSLDEEAMLAEPLVSAELPGPAEPQVHAEQPGPANPGRVERQGKKVKETKTGKSINTMLKQFVDSQEAQDRFVTMEKQRAEDERKRAERENRIREDELVLARELLVKQRKAREAR